METRIAAISLIVEEPASVEALNGILHREKGVNIICVAVDAPQNAINALTGKLGRLSGVSAKAVYSRSEKTEETNRRIKNENC